MQASFKEARNWWAFPAISVLVAGTILSLVLWSSSMLEYRRAQETDFRARAAATQRATQQRLDVYSQALRNAAALFNASGNVSRAEWRRFVAGMRLEQNYPGLLAVAYAPYVDDAGLAAVIRQARRDGIDDYALRPPGRRAQYALVTYAEPFTEQNRKGLGYDMYQDAERRRVMDMARDTGAPAITALVNIEIDTESNPRPAFIMYMPIFRGETPRTVAERREQLIGFVLCPFRMPELMPAVLGELANDLDFALYDDNLKDDAHLFYRNAAADPTREPLLRQQRRMAFGGRDWTMEFASTPALENSTGRYWTYAILGIGLAITLTLSGMLFSLALARRRAVVLAGEMTASLRLSQAKWKLLFSQAPLGISVLDPDGSITDCNQAACAMFKVPRERMIGFNPVRDARDPSLKPWLLRGLAGEQVSFESHYAMTHSNGEGYYRFHFQPLEQESEAPRLMCFMEDISERHLAAEQIATLAQHDSLTGLANRLLLNDRLEQAILAAHREGRQLGLLFFDLDHFKTINDSLGHTTGDAVLVQVAQRTAALLRGSDTVARLGGDEFVVLLRDIDSAEHVAQVAQKIMESIAASIALKEHTLDVTCSIGIALFPADGKDAETLIKNADTAMYHAKESGRNNFQFFTADMNTRVVEALAMEAALRQALREQEFLLHYQPQVAIGSRTLIGMEALIRWQRPGHGMVPPCNFIPVAESRGLIGAIGEWVLHEACRQNRAWQDLGMPAIPVAVNISTLQLRNSTLVETVRHALAQSGLDPRWLELEITESALAHNIEFAIALIGELKTLGIRISIDDFGTGYSSLSYLKRFPIDKLKIDQSFIRDITTDRDDAAITQAIVSMGKNLGMKVIAEGVETIDQLLFLQQHACDEAQGYLFSRPLEANAMTVFLWQHQADNASADLAAI
ncbi:MAG TPA: EAL domain-containing protein [Burkholderiaceae bacterium]|nr:EAL domain-containing protein [Burkholderiaceae bacterium]